MIRLFGIILAAALFAALCILGPRAIAVPGGGVAMMMGGQAAAPPPSGLPVPTVAQNAGFTTLIFNFDFGAGQLCMYDGRTPACVAASPITNWLAPCHTTNTAYMLMQGPGAQTLPCNISIINDSGFASPANQNVADFQYLTTYSSFGVSDNSNSVSAQSIDAGYGDAVKSSTHGVTLPMGVYIESTYRQGSLSSNGTEQTQVAFGGASTTGSTAFPDCQITWALSELFDTNSGHMDAFAGQQPGNTGCPTAPYAGYAQGATGFPSPYSTANYHKYAMLSTNNGSTSAYSCMFVDDLQPQGGSIAAAGNCADMMAGVASNVVSSEFTNSRWTITFFWIHSEKNSTGLTYPTTTRDGLFQYARAWGCANWQTTQCTPGGTPALVTVGNLKYYH